MLVLGVLTLWVISRSKWLDIVIMRDQRKQTLEIEMPDQRTGQRHNFMAVPSAVKIIEVERLG